jgi:hypothetical protein
MVRRSIIGGLTLTFLVVWLTVTGQSPELWLGTWKVDVAKSSWSPGPPSKSQVTTWESLGNGQYKNTSDVVDAKGQTTHSEFTMRFGVEVPMTAAAVPTTRTYRRIDDRTTEYVLKVNGKVTTTTRQIVAPDGKTRTVTTTGTDAQGRTVKTVLFSEKQ